MYFKDIVLPTGDLREPRSGAERADIIVITKCPESLDDHEKRFIVKRISPKKHQAIFFSHIVYDNTLRSKRETSRLEDLKSFTLATGIADASPLVFYLKSKRLRFKHLEYPDHHKFTDNDIAKLEKQSVIVTTKKDFMRLKNGTDLVHISGLNPYSRKVLLSFTDETVRVRMRMWFGDGLLDGWGRAVTRPSKFVYFFLMQIINRQRKF